MPARRRSSSSRSASKKRKKSTKKETKSSQRTPSSSKKSKRSNKKKRETDGSDRSGKHEEQQQNVARNTVLLLLIFVAAGFYLNRVFSHMPAFSEEDVSVLQTHGWSGYLPGPRSISDVKAIKEVILKYRETYYEFVVAAFATLYVFMQVFAIPGTISLSVLAGPLFGVWTGVTLVSLCATSGSSMSFLLSKVLGGPLVRRVSSSRLTWFQGKIQEQIDNQNLFWFMLFIRVTPLLPNVFINVASPLVGVPLVHFFCATFLGLMPANYLHAQTGLTLSEITDDDGLGEKLLYSAVKLGMFGSLALLPTILKRKLAERSGMQQ